MLYDKEDLKQDGYFVVDKSIIDFVKNIKRLDILKYKIKNHNNLESIEKEIYELFIDIARSLVQQQSEYYSLLEFLKRNIILRTPNNMQEESSLDRKFMDLEIPFHSLVDKYEPQNIVIHIITIFELSNNSVDINIERDTENEKFDFTFIMPILDRDILL